MLDNASFKWRKIIVKEKEDKMSEGERDQFFKNENKKYLKIQDSCSNLIQINATHVYVIGGR